MADPLGWVSAELARLDALGLRRRARHRTNPWDHAGRVDLSSNDYLGLARHPDVRAAAAEATRWGAGAGASRLVMGGSQVHVDLERELAAWKRTEDAMVFSSGYLANIGTIGALVGPGDLVASDRLNHASIIDGCRLAGAQVRVFAHSDMAALEALLATHGRQARRILIVTDGVFSMDGDMADLPAICDLAERWEAIVMVDDAHGSGVIGPEGRGTAALLDVAHRVHVHLGTLSKAVGAAGGFVAGRSDLVELLRNRARSYIFDTAPPPAAVAAALQGVQMARTDHELRATAVSRARQLAQGLGLPDPAACIIPLIVGSPDQAVRQSAALADLGFEVVAIRPPSVPEGTSRLRLTTNALLDGPTIQRAIQAIQQVQG